jgi:hypothetical protein
VREASCHALAYLRRTVARHKELLAMLLEHAALVATECARFLQANSTIAEADDGYIEVPLFLQSEKGLDNKLPTNIKEQLHMVCLDLLRMLIAHDKSCSINVVVFSAVPPSRLMGHIMSLLFVRISTPLLVVGSCVVTNAPTPPIQWTCDENGNREEDEMAAELLGYVLSVHPTEVVSALPTVMAAIVQCTRRRPDSPLLDFARRFLTTSCLPSLTVFFFFFGYCLGKLTHVAPSWEKSLPGTWKSEMLTLLATE